MRISITKDIDGSPDGIHIGTYQAGEEYEVGSPQMSQILAECFLDGGNATEIKAAKASTKKVDDTQPKLPVNGG